MTTTLQHKIGQGFLGQFLLAVTFALATLSQSPVAQAQEAPVILVVNQAKLLADSEAGKKLAVDAKNLNEQITAELKKQFETLKKEEEQLIDANKQGLYTQEVLNERVQKLQVKQQNFQIEQQVKQRELQASIQKGQALIGKALQPIYEELIKTRKPTIIIDRSQLAFASPDVNVTAELMKKLNESTPSVPFERVKVEVVKQGEQQNQ